MMGQSIGAPGDPMSIAHCPECGRQVSPRTTVCPGCAAPLARIARTELVGVALLLLGLVGVLLGIPVSEGGPVAGGAIVLILAGTGSLVGARAMAWRGAK
jgi:hypothetical protein